MLPVNFFTSAVTSLNLLKSMQNVDAGGAAVKRAVTGPSPFGTTVSSTASDAILRIQELARAPSMNAESL